VLIDKQIGIQLSEIKYVENNYDFLEFLACFIEKIYLNMYGAKVFQNNTL
jgi:hypothetical protein